jgi:hypothetical protein
MGAVANFFVGLHEAIMLRHAEREALAAGDRRLEVRRYMDAARSRRAAARRLADAVPAITLLEEALELAIVGAAIARGERAEDVDVGVAQIERTSRLHIDELPFAEADELRDALDAQVSRLLGDVDARSVLAVRALRWGRLAGLAVFVAFVAMAIARATILPHNVARHKPVYSSGLRNGATGAELVDGRTRGAYAAATVDSPHSWIAVDLEKVYTLTSIRLYNRGDGWFADSLPMGVDVSEDGVTYHELAKRGAGDVFTVWTIDCPGTRARFVRMTKLVPGYVALNEIEIYSRE